MKSMVRLFDDSIIRWKRFLRTIEPSNHRIIWLLFTILFAAPAHATPVVGDLSNYRIDIDSGYNGTRIFLFGVRNDPGDIVVVVRGPAKDYIIRKKEEVAGLWVNRERMKFFNVPSFYAIAASKRLPDIAQSTVFRQLGIGQHNLLSQPPDPASLNSYEEFASAFLRRQRASRLYVEQQAPLKFMAETLFKTVIEFPDNIPPGRYTAEIYLMNDGQVAGMQSIPVTVVKRGLDAFLYAYAHEYPTVYGITAVVMAMGVGWFASRAFEKI